VGISFRSLVNALDSQGLSLEEVKAVFITHEHSDHIKGLRTLLKKQNLPIYASGGTLEYLASSGHVPPGAVLVECSDSLSVGSLEVTPFPIPHDAEEPVGFRFALPDGRTVCFATDLGHITDSIRSKLTGCDLVVLESNYDKGMLDCSDYPYYLKRRIKSAHGHLSNDESARELVRLVKEGTTRIVLAHLSEQNNLPALAYQTVKQALLSSAMREDSDYILRVAPSKMPKEVLVF